MSALPGAVAEVTDCFLREVDDRLPGRLRGLFLHGSLCWGEFFPGSDVDFVGLWEALPDGADLAALKAAHEATRTQFPATVLDGFHCTAEDLAADATTVGGRPVFYQGEFAAAGTLDINPVTWHELSERPVIVRGPLPRVRTDLGRLAAFTRNNLDTYWRGTLERVDQAGAGAVGELDGAVAWVVLGAARLHHLLTQGRITSKSGAGRYVVEHLDPRWTPIAQEALRIRERPDSPSQYDDLARRGQDLVELLAWLVEDGTAGRR